MRSTESVFLYNLLIFTFWLSLSCSILIKLWNFNTIYIFSPLSSNRILTNFVFSDLLPILVCLQLPWLTFSGKNLRCWMLPHLVPTMDPTAKTAALQLLLKSQSLSSIYTANQNLLTKNKTYSNEFSNLFVFVIFLRFDAMNIRQSTNIMNQIMAWLIFRTNIFVQILKKKK